MYMHTCGQCVCVRVCVCACVRMCVCLPFCVGVCCGVLECVAVCCVFEKKTKNTGFETSSSKLLLPNSDPVPKPIN